MPEPPELSAGELTVADEVLVLHCYSKAWGSIDPNVAAAVFGDLALAGRISVRETDAKWWQRVAPLNRGTSRFRLFVDDSTPLEDQALDSALDQLAAETPAPDPKWCLRHISPWKDVLTRLVRGGVLITDKDASHGAAERANNMTLRSDVEQSLQGELRGTLLDSGAPDERTGAVLLLASSGNLLKSGTKVRELIGPVDRAVMRARLKSLASLPELAPVQVFADAVVELRNQATTNEAFVWQVSS